MALLIPWLEAWAAKHAWKLVVGGVVAVAVLALTLWVFNSGVKKERAHEATAAAADNGHVTSAGSEISQAHAGIVEHYTETHDHTIEIREGSVAEIKAAPDLAGVVGAWSDGIDRLRDDARNITGPVIPPGAGGGGGTQAVPSEPKAAGASH